LLCVPLLELLSTCTFISRVFFRGCAKGQWIVDWFGLTLEQQRKKGYHQAKRLPKDAGWSIGAGAAKAERVRTGEGYPRYVTTVLAYPYEVVEIETRLRVPFFFYFLPTLRAEVTWYWEKTFEIPTLDGREGLGSSKLASDFEVKTQMLVHVYLPMRAEVTWSWKERPLKTTTPDMSVGTELNGGKESRTYLEFADDGRMVDFEI
jgi:hypothetical protein